jgi:RNA polymerase sigma-70 factor (ECF subfamily)
MLDIVSSRHEAALRRTVAKARSGDPAAVGRLYDLFAGRVYRFALVRVDSPADAEDLLQRTFLKVIEALPRYEERGLPFAAWLFRIARNAVIDFERTRHGHVDLDAIAEHADEGQGPAALAEAASERAAIRAGIERLTADQRAVIEYRFFAGLSHREIGLLMNRNDGAVRALQFRAIESLRDHLGSLPEFMGSAEGRA